MRIPIAIVGAALVAGLSSAWAGDVTGKITLKGNPPPGPALPLGSDPACGRLRPSEKPTMPFYVVGADGGLADVLVYLKGADLKGEVPSKPALLDQKGCEYIPYILGMQAGQRILIRNSDPLFHNVHAQPRANDPFNLAQTAGAKDIERVFSKPEVFVRFKCDVHPWMFAYVGVLPHPYFAVTGKDGSFKLEGVPAGKYELVAFHRKTHVTEDKAYRQEITVGDSATTADIVIEVPEAP